MGIGRRVECLQPPFPHPQTQNGSTLRAQVSRSLQGWGLRAGGRGGRLAR